METFAAVFAYDVAADARGAFEAVYGPDGDWARFFRGGEGYVGTELWRQGGGDPLHYLVIDRWRTESDYAAFLAANDDEYRRRGGDAERLWLSERVVGRFVRP